MSAAEAAPVANIALIATAAERISLEFFMAPSSGDCNDSEEDSSKILLRKPTVGGHPPGTNDFKGGVAKAHWQHTEHEQFPTCRSQSLGLGMSASCALSGFLRCQLSVAARHGSGRD